MAITAQLVKDLREMTGCGMMDSKKALEATNGDIDAAVDLYKNSAIKDQATIDAMTNKLNGMADEIEQGLIGAKDKLNSLLDEAPSFTLHVYSIPNAVGAHINCLYPINCMT